MPCIGHVRQPLQPPGCGAMPSEGIQGDEWDAYVTLDTYNKDERGIAYGARALGRRSSHSSRRGHDLPRRTVTPSTGRRGTGDGTRYAGRYAKLRYQSCLDESVEPVQVDIGQDWGCHPTLWSTRQGGVEFPVLQVSGSEHVRTSRRNRLSRRCSPQYPDGYLVVETVETLSDASFDEPGRPRPGIRDFFECRVASSAGTETVGAVGESRLVVRFEEQAYRLRRRVCPPRTAGRAVFVSHSSSGCRRVGSAGIGNARDVTHR